MISDNDEDGNRGNRHATPDDEELARQLQVCVHCTSF